MIRATEPVTLLRDSAPRRPIHCSVCGALIGSWWLYQTTHYPYMSNCTDACERLIAFTRERAGVPREWREYPQEWRGPLLAAAMIEAST